MTHNPNQRNEGPWPLISIGVGVAAGWLLRKFFQEKYNETHPLSPPQSEKELVTAVFGEYTAEARDYYQEVQAEISRNLRQMKENLEDIDTDKYRELVNEAIENVDHNNELPRRQIDKLRRYLMDDFDQVRSQAQKKAKKVARKTRKAVES